MNGSQELTKICLSQAEVFLQDAGEFYPFGAAIDAQGDIRPFGAGMEEEFPGSAEVVRLLTEGVHARLKDGHFKSAAICVDVAVSLDRNKADAVEIRLFDQDLNMKSTYYRYVQVGEGYSFELLSL